MQNLNFPSILCLPYPRADVWRRLWYYIWQVGVGNPGGFEPGMTVHLCCEGTPDSLDELLPGVNAGSVKNLFHQRNSNFYLQTFSKKI